MAAGQDRTGSSAYRPTSLDFINLPNPIQPALPSQKHPLNGTPQLEKARLETASTQDLLRLVVDPTSGVSSKRLRTLENANLDLPKLPVRNNAKRLRIPPTLSGLHEPPPDAGLLPSISIEQHTNPPPRPKEAATFIDDSERSAAVATPTAGQARSTVERLKKQSSKPAKRNKWTVQETEHLIKGVSRFGVGNWTRIKNCPDYHFSNRTALDLKDRFRVCFPDHNKPEKSRACSKIQDSSSDTDGPPRPNATCVPRGPASERVDTSTLHKLGIKQPFIRSERRSRHGYSAAEDEALLRGFMKHGKAWTAIRQDADLDLLARQATDLRDRMRTRFPEEYAKAGLAPKAKKQSHVEKRADATVVEDAPAVKTTGSKERVFDSCTSTQPSVTTLAKPMEPRKTQQQALFSLDDVYLGRLSDDEDAEHEPITLDRGILDWATDTARMAPAEAPRPPDINLPPMHAPDPPLSQGGQGNGTTALPSLASLLPDSHTSEHLELPSLTEWWGHNDGRPGGSSFPSLEDILSHDM